MTEKLLPLDEKGVCGPVVYLLRNYAFLNALTIGEIIAKVQENYLRLTNKTLYNAHQACDFKGTVSEMLNLDFFQGMTRKDNEEKINAIKEFIVPQMLKVYGEKLFVSTELQNTIRTWLAQTLASYLTDEQIKSSQKTQSLPSHITEKRTELGTRLSGVATTITPAEFELLLLILHQQFTDPKLWEATGKMITMSGPNDFKLVTNLVSLFPLNISYEFRQIVADYCFLCAAAQSECANLAMDLESKLEIFKKKYFK